MSRRNYQRGSSGAPRGGTLYHTLGSASVTSTDREIMAMWSGFAERIPLWKRQIYAARAADASLRKQGKRKITLPVLECLK